MLFLFSYLKPSILFSFWMRLGLRPGLET